MTKKMTFDLTCDILRQTPFRKMQHIRTVEDRATKCHFRIENQFSSLTEGRREGRAPPPPSAGRLRKYPIGARVKVVSEVVSRATSPPWKCAGVRTNSGCAARMSAISTINSALYSQPLELSSGDYFDLLLSRAFDKEYSNYLGMPFRCS